MPQLPHIKADGEVLFFSPSDDLADALYSVTEDVRLARDVRSLAL